MRSTRRVTAPTRDPQVRLHRRPAWVRACRTVALHRHSPARLSGTRVVLIHIQDTDVVVLRGLNLSHQGTVTGGIEWISAHGGSVHLDDVVVNGFPGKACTSRPPQASSS